MVLDKNALIPDSNSPILDIYIANDYGYCGDFNSSVRREILKNTTNDKIIIGKYRKKNTNPISKFFNPFLFFITFLLVHLSFHQIFGKV